MNQQTEHGFKAPIFSDYSPAAFRGETPARRDVVEGRLPRGKVVLLAGGGDVGKSFLLLQGFEAINGGLSHEAFGGRIVSPGLPCICIMGEDDFSSIDLRLKSIRSHHSAKPVTHGAIIPAPNVGYMGRVKRDYDQSIVATEALEWLERQIASLCTEYGELGFVAIDTFSSLLPVDANSPEEGQSTMSLLTHIATKYDVCIIVTHHLRKTEDLSTSVESLRYAIRGSTAIVDAVRAAYVMYKYKADEAASIRKELQIEHDGEIVGLQLVKNNLGLRRDPITFMRMPDGCLVDISNSLRKRITPEDALQQIVRAANVAGKKLTRTGNNGLYANRLSTWPGGVGSLPKAKLDSLANELLASGHLIQLDYGLVATEMRTDPSS